MGLILIIVVLVLIFGGGGSYYGYSRYGGRGAGGILGVVLTVLLIVWLIRASYCSILPTPWKDSTHALSIVSNVAM